MKIGYKRDYPKTLEFCCGRFYKEIYVKNTDILDSIHDISGGEFETFRVYATRQHLVLYTLLPFLRRGNNREKVRSNRQLVLTNRHEFSIKEPYYSAERISRNA